MKIEEIRREKVSTIAEPIANVLDEAREVLGYKTRATHNSTVQSPLRSTLASLDIEPLNEADVVRYQAEMVAELMLDPKFQAERLSNSSREYRFFHYWACQKLESYSDPIPEFVLHKAVQIKKACPEVEFFIQELEGSPDPFLVARLGHDDWAFIEVWEEPKFEGRLR